MCVLQPKLAQKQKWIAEYLRSALLTLRSICLTIFISFEKLFVMANSRGIQQRRRSPGKCPTETMRRVSSSGHCGIYIYIYVCVYIYLYVCVRIIVGVNGGGLSFYALIVVVVREGTNARCVNDGWTTCC